MAYVWFFGACAAPVLLAVVLVKLLPMTPIKAGVNTAIVKVGRGIVISVIVLLCLLVVATVILVLIRIGVWGWGIL